MFADDVCAICLEHFAANSSHNIHKTVCGHSYHILCIQGYWDTCAAKNAKQECPMCRTLIAARPAAQIAVVVAPQPHTLFDVELYHLASTAPCPAQSRIHIQQHILVPMKIIQASYIASGSAIVNDHRLIVDVSASTNAPANSGLVLRPGSIILPGSKMAVGSRFYARPLMVSEM